MCANRAKRARVREGFKKPTVEEVAAHIAEKGYTFDAEEFWNFYESKGWRVGSHVMRSWTSACVTWQKIENRRAKRDAHFDAKMDERYSSRVCSRLKELCLPLHLKGADKRKWSAAKQEGGAE